MDIRIQYFGSVRAAAKKSEEKIEVVANITVYDFLQQLICLHEESFHSEIFNENGKKLRDDLTVTLNGTIINHSSATEINLQPGDVLSLFPIFPGGG
jgi:MoaD family protein